MFEPVILIAAVLICIVLGLTLFSSESRRRTLKTLAGRLGARFTVRDPGSVPDVLHALYFMQRGHSAATFNIIRGRLHATRYVVLDYRYEIGSRADRAIVKGSLILCQTQEPLPCIVALRDQPFDQIGGYRQFKPVPLDDPRFDQRFSLYADQPDPVHRMLPQPIRDLLLTCPDVDFQFYADHVVFHSRSDLTSLQIVQLVHRGTRCARWLDAQPR